MSDNPAVRCRFAEEESAVTSPTTSQTTEAARQTRALAPLALMLAGVCFAAYQALRPYSAEQGSEGAVSMASGLWQLSHVLGMVSFALLLLGQVLIGVPLLRTSARRPALVAATGAALCAFGLLPYGGETFGLGAVAAEAVSRQDPSLLAIAEGIRMAPVAAGFFTLGCLGLLVSAVASMVVLARTGRVGALGVPLVVGAVLLIPQYFGDATIRIGYGVLLGSGLVLAGLAFSRRSRPSG